MATTCPYWCVSLNFVSIISFNAPHTRRHLKRQTVIVKRGGFRKCPPDGARTLVYNSEHFIYLFFIFFGLADMF